MLKTYRNKSNILMGLGLHSCGIWLRHRLIETRLFETTKWSHLEGCNIRRNVSTVFNNNKKKKYKFQWRYGKPKEGIWKIIALY